MKFVVDAQPPRRLAILLNRAGFDALHTLDLPLANRTPDAFINDFSINEQRTLITKDADFVDSFLLHKKPYKLLLISTGNIRNSELEILFLANIEKINESFEAGFAFIEISRKAIVIHS